MACAQANYQLQKVTTSLNPLVPATPTNPGGKYLVVSNSPESIGNQEKPTLYRCEFPILGASNGVRVWAWHKDNAAEDLDLALFLSVDTGSASVQNYVDFSGRSDEPQFDGSLEALGMCIAKVQLYQTFGPSASYNLTTTETQVWTDSFDDGSVLGLIAQFSVTSTTGSKLRVRVAQKRAGESFGDWNSDVAPKSQHIAGWYTKSTATLRLPDKLDAKPNGTGADWVDCTICKQSGPELDVTNGWGYQGQTIDPKGTTGGNKGTYGANVNYDFQLYNTDPDHNHAVWFYFVGYDDRLVHTLPIPEYFGAAPITSPTGYPTYGLLPIKQNIGGLYNNLDPIAVDENYDSKPVIVPKGTSADDPVIVTVQVANGGAAALPVILRASRINQSVP